MPDNQDKLRVLYDAVSKDYDLGAYDQFSQKMQDSNKRKAFFDGVGSEYQLGTYDEFENKIGVKKKELSTPPAKPLSSGVATLSLTPTTSQSSESDNGQQISFYNPSSFLGGEKKPTQQETQQLQPRTSTFREQMLKERQMFGQKPSDISTIVPKNENAEQEIKFKEIAYEREKKAITNTAKYNLSKRGITKPTEDDLQDEEKSLRNKLHNNELGVTKDKFGDPALSRPREWYNVIGHTFTESVTHPFTSYDVNKKVISKDYKGLVADYNKEQAEQPLIPESYNKGGASDYLSEMVGGLPMMMGVPLAGTIATGTPFGGAAAYGALDAWNKLKDDLYKNYADLKKQYPDAPEEVLMERASDIAKNEAPINFATGTAIGLAGNVAKGGGILAGLETRGATQTAKQALKQNLKGIAKEIGFVSGTMGTGSAIKEGVEYAGGVDKKLSDVAQHSIDAMGDGALMTVIFKLAHEGVALPKATKGAIKEYLATQPEYLVDGMLSEMGKVGEGIQKKLTPYRELRKQFEGVVPDEQIGVFTQWQEKVNGIKDEIKSLEKKKNLVGVSEEKIDKKIGDKNKQIAEIQKKLNHYSKTGIITETDDATGEKITTTTNLENSPYSIDGKKVSEQDFINAMEDKSLSNKQWKIDANGDEKITKRAVDFFNGKYDEKTDVHENTTTPRPETQGEEEAQIPTTENIEGVGKGNEPITAEEGSVAETKPIKVVQPTEEGELKNSSIKGIKLDETNNTNTKTILENSKGTVFEKLAEAISPYLDKIKTLVSSNEKVKSEGKYGDGSMNDGLYEDGNIKLGNNTDLYHFYHEATHAATVEKIKLYDLYKLRDEQRNKSALENGINLTEEEVKSIDELNRIYDTVKSNSNNFAKNWFYGLSNLKEFIAEAFTNKEFQNYLKNTKSEGKKTNIFNDFLNVISKILGVKDAGILNDIFAHTEDLIGKKTEQPKEAIPNVEDLDIKIKEAQSNHDAAKRELDKAIEKVGKTQGEQTSMFDATQKGMFAVDENEAKKILDPLKQKVKETKDELDNLLNRKKIEDEKQQELFDEEKPITKRQTNAEIRSKLKEIDEAKTPESLALEYFANGGKVNANELTNEVVGSVGDSRLTKGSNKKRIAAERGGIKEDALVSNTDKNTIKQVAEDIYKAANKHLDSDLVFDEQDVRNALIEVLGNHQTWQSVAEEYINSYHPEEVRKNYEKQLEEHYAEYEKAHKHDFEDLSIDDINAMLLEEAEQTDNFEEHLNYIKNEQKSNNATNEGLNKGAKIEVNNENESGKGNEKEQANIGNQSINTETNALQVRPTTQEISRPITTGENITESSGGVRPSEQGETPTQESRTETNIKGEKEIGSIFDEALEKVYNVNENGEFKKADIMAENKFKSKYGEEGKKVIDIVKNFKKYAEQLGIEIKC